MFLVFMASFYNLYLLSICAFYYIIMYGLFMVLFILVYVIHRFHTNLSTIITFTGMYKKVHM